MKLLCLCLLFAHAALAAVQLTGSDTEVIFGSTTTNLYQLNSVTLKTDGNLVVGGNLTVLGGTQNAGFSAAYSPSQTVIQNGPLVPITLVATAGSCNIVNNAYVVPVTGWYEVHLNAFTGDMTTQTMLLYLYVNGVQQYMSLGAAWQGNAPCFWSANYALQLSAGQQVTFAAQLEFGSASSTIQLTQVWFKLLQ